jgi:raffinose/stachyose/melibiose transport system substrate-binding protein
MKRIALAAMLGLMAFAPAQAQTTVTYLNINTGENDQALMAEAGAAYAAANPGVTVEFPVLENEAFKSKLTTLLQSPDAPDVFHSWGGGVFEEQARAGVLRPIDDLLSQEAKDAVGQAGVAHFTAKDGHIYGIARNVQGVMIWYNKKLLADAGVDPASLSIWSGFLAGVQKLKDAGITPLSLGGKDKWPAQFYWAYLIIRNLGHDGFTAAMAGENGGWNNPAVVRAGDMLNELAALEPFQQGYQAAGYGDSCATFGDQKAAMHLMGEWDYNCSKDSSANKMGVGDDNLGLIPFPSIEGGAGQATDSLGGMEGFVFSKAADDEAVKFIEWFNSKDEQSKFAAKSIYIPISKGAADALPNQFHKSIAELAGNSTWHQLFFDQTLGANVGGQFNDLALELASGELTGAEAAEMLEEAAADER